MDYLLIDYSPTLSVAGCQPAGCEDAVHQRRGSVAEVLQLWGSRRGQSQSGGWGIEIPLVFFPLFVLFFFLNLGEALAALTRGVSLAAGANLKGVDMEGSQMTGINLRVATLKNAKLKNCNLRGATLAGTDLEVRALRRTAVVFCRCLPITRCFFFFLLFLLLPRPHPPRTATCPAVTSRRRTWEAPTWKAPSLKRCWPPCTCPRACGETHFPAGNAHSPAECLMINWYQRPTRR